MAEIVRFVDGVSYTEADQADFNMRMMRPQGVIAESTLGTLIISAIGGLSVRVGPGEAFIQGFQYKNDANKDVSIAANGSGSTRIDLVVLSLNRSGNTLIATVKQGTPGAGAPALTQVVGGNWEFLIATVTVVNAAASIVSGNIADGRVFSRWPTLALDTALATDAEVTTAVAGEATARDTAISAAVAAEATLRTNADNAEITARGNAVANEASARTSADTTLQNNINSEASARAAADASEATTRANADTTLQNNINAANTARANADTTLQNNINAEASTRGTADNALDARLDVLEGRSIIFASGYISGGGSIFAGKNISSVTRHSAGAYTVNFTGGPGHQFYAIAGAVHTAYYTVKFTPLNGNQFSVTINSVSTGLQVDSDFTFILVQI